MNFVCEESKCTACGTCVEACPQSCIHLEDLRKSIRAVINKKQCCDCHLCKWVCPAQNGCVFQKPVAWYQGWTRDVEIHKNAASGGVATAIEKAFIESGGYVSSCAFSKGEFAFLTSKNSEVIHRFAGSKYIKSSVGAEFKQIKNLIASGKKVLFVGLPCQVAAVKRFVGESQNGKLYTIDLICHGTPSIKMLDIFLKQYGAERKKISDILFREKDSYILSGKDRLFSTRGTMDCYSIAFMYALTYTDNCYNCIYAKSERVSDLTLGDSWGSDLPVDLREQGLSLILCQNNQGKELLQMCDLELRDVDLNNAIQNNAQLQYPSVKPRQREPFFKRIEKGVPFNRAVFMAYPKLVLKQKVKAFLIRLGIKNAGGGYQIVGRN